ncbi:T9SS type A sorting domain-containing protein [Chryseobacterium camelliae]|uniref:T9SS type A sorting domain-containing protein n=1 Tax=Chryseobacterium camelliae TaxID=1265445 RepID=A0ABY7QQ14_9FLAO|nr:T9SS type A sorting domain-containing protein [Chryseobacterium camelliae]WBV61740.1 T9SS type A sorting domain-containing protein [Chryseobacterium camelliae]
MRKIYSLAVILMSSLVFAQVSLTSTSVAYTQNFDGMAATTVLPTGWNAIRASGSGTVGQALTPVVNDGTSNTGAVFNVGTANAADRALGTIASGSTVPAFGAQFVNNTGAAITSVNISFNHEQWRTGSNAVVETVTFFYSTDATALDNGTWIPVTNLDLVEILTSNNANIAVDGNLTANKAAKSNIISGLNIANGGSLFIKWVDANETGSDGMYAVDDFSLMPSAGSLAVSDFGKTKSLFVKNTFVKNNEIVFGANAKDVKVFNMFGQVVKTASVKADGTLNVADLAKGNYIVTGTVNNEAVSQKILKD